MITGIYILLGLNLLGTIVALIVVLKKNDVVVGSGKELIFKDDNDIDWVIKKQENKLITGIKQGNIIIKRSTI